MAVYDPYRSSAYNLQNAFEGISLSRTQFPYQSQSLSSPPPPPPLTYTQPKQQLQQLPNYSQPYQSPAYSSSLPISQQLPQQSYCPPPPFEQRRPTELASSYLQPTYPQPIVQSSDRLRVRDPVIVRESNDSYITNSLWKPYAFNSSSIIAQSSYANSNNRAEFGPQKIDEYSIPFRSNPYQIDAYKPTSVEPQPREQRPLAPYPVIRGEQQQQQWQQQPQQYPVSQRIEEIPSYPVIRGEIPLREITRPEEISIIRDRYSQSTLKLPVNAQNNRNFDSRIYESDDGLRQSFGPASFAAAQQQNQQQSQLQQTNNPKNTEEHPDVVVHPSKIINKGVDASQQRDQNYYQESYVNVKGLGTFKKYPMKNRKKQGVLAGFHPTDQAAVAATSMNYNPSMMVDNSNPLSQSTMQAQQLMQQSLWQSDNMLQQQFQQQQLQQSQGSLSYSAPAGMLNLGYLMRSLVEIAEIEGRVEHLKNQLLQIEDYNLPTLFALFDTRKEDKLAIQDFIEATAALPQALSQQQAMLIFTRFKSTFTQYLNYEDFQLMSLPQLNQDISSYVTSFRPLKEGKGINQDTVDAFTRMLIELSDSELAIQGLRKKITDSSTRVDELYRQLNCERNGRLTLSELEAGLLNYSQEDLTAEQAALLFYRLCSNKSTYLTFDDFERFCYSGDQGRQDFLKQSALKNSTASQLALREFPSKSAIFKESAERNWRKSPELAKTIEKFFKNAKLEGEIEATGKYLLTKRDLKLFNLFALFKPQNNFVDVYSFAEGLKNVLGMKQADTEDVLLVFRKLKSAGSSQLDIIDFNEFCRLIIPVNERPPRELYEKDKNYELNMYSETISFLVKLFKMHLNNEVLFNELRVSLAQSTISIEQLFDSLAKGKSYLEKKDFDASLKEYGSPFSQKEHYLLFQRFDPKQDGITSLTNFSLAMRV